MARDPSSTDDGARSGESTAQSSTGDADTSVGRRSYLKLAGATTVVGAAAAGALVVSGDDSDDGDDSGDSQQTAAFDAEGEDEPTDYYLEVDDGELEPSTDAASTWVSDDGTRAAGRVVDGRHTWAFDAELVDVTVDGPADLLVDGELSSLEQFPLEGATGNDWKDDMPWHDAAAGLEQTLVIDGVGSTGETKYEFRVSGAVEPTTDADASIDDDTSIEDGRVSGQLHGWRDAFAFDGDLESLTIDGTARVTLDGEEIDPSEYGDDHDHILTIVSDGSSGSYEVSVDGWIETIAWDDSSEYASIEDGTTATGTIESDYQRFRYAGSITDLTVDEESVTVYVDRERIDPDDY